MVFVSGVLYLKEQLAIPSTQPIEFIVEPGWSGARIGNVLAQQGIIPHAWLFRGYLRFIADGHPKAGHYRFAAGLNTVDIINKLQDGAVVSYSFVIPEGYNLSDISRTLVKSGWPDAPRYLADPTLPKQFGLSSPTLEGWLFPDTYYYRAGDTIERVIKMMVDRTVNILDQEFANRPDGYKLDPYQTLILASIIEKETGQASERAQIAAVFHNRLKKHMRLQSDPTVIYGIADYDGNITRHHLKTHTPYNTYTIPALPPTPIASPGRDAIHATLHPVESRALFFVSRGNGTHIFSETYAQHKQYVNQYQRRRKN
ncbi:MAG: endolytic transglycosylase MltG [Magnetococcales bacterium]|nr:endolytic transglycosylase MltG [Magnetococcales bacterium]